MDYAEKILHAVDANKAQLLDFAVELVSTPSPTGEEKQVAEIYHRRLREIGLETSFQEVEAERPNVIGVYKGTGDGLDIMFNGHMDTSITGKEPELGPSYKSPLRVQGDYLLGGIGWGLTNMKGPLVAYGMAVKAVKDAGDRSGGDRRRVACQAQLLHACLLQPVCRRKNNSGNVTDSGPKRTREFRGLAKCQ
jgi:acetylornithine deacetylase/succinyl-diaminopimelate desuccinylase-like protein